MDALNAGLWALLTADAQLQDLVNASGDVDSKGTWNGAADEGAPLPLVRFNMVGGDYAYDFGGLSSKRFVYSLTGWSDASAKAAAVLAGHLERITTDPAALAVAGHTVLLCRPSGPVPPGAPSVAGGRQFYQGVLIEVVLT